MAEYEIVRHCAPTLAGLKTANMFSAHYDTKEELNRDIRELNKRLRAKGLCVIPFSYKDGRALIYIYRPGKLKEDLMCNIAEQFVMANEAPDDEALAACKALGEALL